MDKGRGKFCKKVMGLLHFATNVFAAKACCRGSREGQVIGLAVKYWHWIVCI
jgi:hypothetical protein